MFAVGLSFFVDIDEWKCALASVGAALAFKSSPISQWILLLSAVD